MLPWFYRITRCALLLGIVGLTACGCKKAAPAPATRPAVPSTPSESTLATRPASSIGLTLAGKPYLFFAPRIYRETVADHDVLMIYSDGNDQANGFYFEIPLESDSPEVISWQWQTRQEEKSDSLVGITLPTVNQMLQPVRLNFTLQPQGPQAWHVSFSGDFLVYPLDSDTALVKVPASGDFVAQVETAKAR